jgi:hypothetical protein
MLFHQWNGQHFPQRLKIFRTELMEESKIGNKNTYSSCLNNLDEWGDLEYFPSKSKTKPAKSRLRFSPGAKLVRVVIPVMVPTQATPVPLLVGVLIPVVILVLVPVVVPFI